MRWIGVISAIVRNTNREVGGSTMDDHEWDAIRAEVDGVLEHMNRYHVKMRERLRVAQEAVNLRIAARHCVGCGSTHWATGKCPGEEPPDHSGLKINITGI
jgi:hypothetical protein